MATPMRHGSGERTLPPSTTASEAQGLGELLREVAGEAGTLVQQEIELAKLELREAMASATLDAVKILVALVLAAVGGLCFVVFMILGIGTLLDGAYWAGALITGALLLLVGGILTGSAVRDLKRGLKPKHTVETLREDGAFAREQVRELRDKMGA